MGEERNGTDFLREKYLLDWVSHFVKPCPPGADNHLCYKMRADIAFQKYSNDAAENQMPQGSRAEFALAVMVLNPTARLSDWVYLDRQNPFKEFSGVLLDHGVEKDGTTANSMPIRRTRRSKATNTAPGKSK